MGKHLKKEVNIYRSIIWTFIAVTVLSLISILHTNEIRRLEQEVNKLKFEKEYLEFVREDNKEQNK